MSAVHESPPTLSRISGPSEENPPDIFDRDGTATKILPPTEIIEVRDDREMKALSPSEERATSDSADGSPPGITAYFSDQNAPSSFDFLAATAPARTAKETRFAAVAGDYASPDQPTSVASATSFEHGSSTVAFDSFDDDYDETHAWIPSERTRRSLDRAAAPGTVVDDEVTTPRILMVEALGDPVLDLLKRVSGHEEAAKRETLKVGEVEEGRDGLNRLIATENYRAAVDLTKILLQAAFPRNDDDDDDDGGGVVTRLTPAAMQLWTTRLTLMMYKLRLYPAVEAELSAFGDLDRPDLYLEYYREAGTESPRAARGSLVPFSLRVLWAELPIFTGKPGETLDRLFSLLSVVEEMMVNLDEGRSADGIASDPSPAAREKALPVWRRRRLLLLYSIANALFLAKDVHSAVDILDRVVDEEADAQRKSAVLSAAGRMLLQFGDIRDAADYFARADDISSERPTPASEATKAMHRGFLFIGSGNFSEAANEFNQAWSRLPGSAVMANNSACMSVYRGYLKRAVPVLGLPMAGEDLPVEVSLTNHLHEGMLFNLATLLEFEPSLASQRKREILELVAQHKGDGFNPQCLKIA